MNKEYHFKMVTVSESKEVYILEVYEETEEVIKYVAGISYNPVKGYKVMSNETNHTMDELIKMHEETLKEELNECLGCEYEMDCGNIHGICNQF